LDRRDISTCGIGENSIQNIKGRDHLENPDVYNKIRNPEIDVKLKLGCEDVKRNILGQCRVQLWAPVRNNES
jgi:hypothetical protein